MMHLEFVIASKVEWVYLLRIKNNSGTSLCLIKEIFNRISKKKKT